MNLKIQNLKTEVEGKEILKGVDLEVKSGEVHAIMGPNGSGKSTLAYTLAGHPRYKVTDGKVILNTQFSILSDKRQMTSDKKKQVSRIKDQEIDILSLTPSERARAGVFLAFQYPVSVEGVSVQSFLWRTYSALHSDKRQVTNDKKEVQIVESIVGFRDFKRKLVEYCNLLGLDENFLGRGLNEGFSGGERKKLEILQMLALRPNIIILDETDSGTDVDAMKKVACGVENYMKVKRETMVIIITHYNRIFKYIRPNYIHVLLDGRVVKSGGKRLSEEVEKSGFGRFRIK